MAAARAERSLHSLLAETYRTCPTVRKPVTTEFVVLWKDEIDRVYAVPEERLLPVLIANHEVAACAGGRDGEDYRLRATVNVARASARLGEEWSETAEQAVANHDEDELPWLNWCRWWARGRRGNPPALDWQPTTNRWQAVADGCRLLTADNHETSEAALFIAQSDSPKAENTPLAYLRRLAHLEKARRLLAENQWEEVLQITDKVDGDGTFPQLCGARGARQWIGKRDGGRPRPARPVSRLSRGKACEETRVGGLSERFGALARAATTLGGIGREAC